MKLKTQYQEVFKQYQDCLKNATKIEELLKGNQEQLVSLAKLLPLNLLKDNKEVKKAEKARRKLIFTLKNYYSGEEYEGKVSKVIISNLLDNNERVEMYFRQALRLEKSPILSMLITWFPLSSEYCYFCLQCNNCSNCPYAVNHKDCNSPNSDYIKIASAKANLNGIIFTATACYKGY